MMMLAKRNPRNVTLNRWDPFAELAGFRRLLDQPFGFLGTAPFGELEGDLTWRPVADVSQTRDGFTVKVELPGMKQEEIQINVEGNVLTVKGERKQEAETSEDGYVRTERVYGSFERSFALPTSVDLEAARASYRDGLLEIRLPKKEEAKPKTVKIETA